MKEFREKFQIEKLKIVQLGSWVISLRPNQVTIGSMILSLNRKCQTFGELSVEEGKELAIAFHKIEELLKKAFNPDKINYLALMMVDEQVHYHIIPRYEDSVRFKNVEYKDEFWPMPPNILESLKFTEAELKELNVFLKSNV